MDGVVTLSICRRFQEGYDRAGVKEMLGRIGGAGDDGGQMDIL